MAAAAEQNTHSGIQPAKQERSQRRQREILDAAHRLLEQVGYERMKMEDIAAEANCSVGSLYQRFHKKEGLLDALLAESLQELDDLIATRLSPAQLSSASREEMIAAIVDIAVNFFRDNQSFIRAITHRQLRDPAGVSPLQSKARDAVAATLGAIGTKFPEFGSESAQLGFAYGMQIVIGVCTNAILNRPGPYQIDDTHLPGVLIATVDRMMQIDTWPTPSSPAPSN